MRRSADRDRSVGFSSEERHGVPKDAVDRLGRLAAGIEAVMLTGDNARTARAVARALGIQARAELLPEDKQRIVRELQAGGGRGEGWGRHQ